jgi:hypothetical protein
MFALHPFRLIGARPQPAPHDDRPQRADAMDRPQPTHAVDWAPDAATARIAAPEAAAAPEDDHALPAPAIARVDPPGLRVVPLRPDGAWPLRRAMDRVPSPFRAFPFRSLHLARMMAPIDPRD